MGSPKNIPVLEITTSVENGLKNIPIGRNQNGLIFFNFYIGTIWDHPLPMFLHKKLTF